MNILVACEQFGKVRTAFRAKGHNAVSCDTEPARDGSEFHIYDDVMNHLVGWDMIIAFPPCTYLTNARNAYWATKDCDEYRELMANQARAIDFVFTLYAACSIVCIENPVGILSTKWRQPDQIIQPYQFGHPFKKRTCLWLKGLPKLRGTEYMGCIQPPWHGHTYDPVFRSETFQGIADAMADQWG